jgi:hypothetical protein
MSVSCIRNLTIMALAMLGFANNALAGQRAEVGIVKADSSILLYKDRFQDKVPDGTAVAELSAEISNGFLLLIRKGFDLQDACLQHVTRLVDAQGLPISSLNPGQRLYLVDQVAVQISDCNDSGCADDIPAPSWCDMSERSGGECRCHVRGPNNTTFITDPQNQYGLCWTWRERLESILSDWVKPPFIQIY